MSDYLKNDEYWEKHINKKLEEDIWIDEYKKYFENGRSMLRFRLWSWTVF